MVKKESINYNLFNSKEMIQVVFQAIIEKGSIKDCYTLDYNNLNYNTCNYNTL